MVDILVKPAADADLANAVVIEDAMLPLEDVDAAALGLPYDTPLEFRVLGTAATATIATPVPEVTVPAQMAAPTGVGGLAQLTIQFAPDPDDGGAELTVWKYQFTLTTDTGWADITGTGQSATGDDILVTDVPAGTYMIRALVGNEEGDAADWSEPSDPVTVTAAGYTATPDDFDADLITFGSDFARGYNRADILIDGDTNAPDGTAIMAELIDGDTDVVVHAAKQIGTASAGRFTGVYTGAQRYPTHLRPRTWVDGDMTKAVTNTTFQVGCTMLFAAASNLHRGFTLGSSADGPLPTVSDRPGQFQFYYQPADNPPGPTSPYMVRQSTVGTASVEPIRPAIVELARLMQDAFDCPVTVGFITRSGTSFVEWLKDPEEGVEDPSPWSYVLDMTSQMQANGAKIDAVEPYTDKNDDWPDRGEHVAAHFLGKYLDGTDIPGIDRTQAFAGVTLGGITINHVLAEAIPDLMTGRTQVVTNRLWVPTVAGAPLEPPNQPHEISFVEAFPTIGQLGYVASNMVLTDPRLDPGASDIDYTHFSPYHPHGMRMHFKMKGANMIFAGDGIASGIKMPRITNIEWSADDVRLTANHPISTVALQEEGLAMANFPNDPTVDATTPGDRRVMGLTFTNALNAINTDIVTAGTDTEAVAGILRVRPNTGDPNFVSTSTLYYMMQSGGMVLPSGSDINDWRYEAGGIHRHVPGAVIPQLTTMPPLPMTTLPDAEDINAANGLPPAEYMTVAVDGLPRPYSEGVPNGQLNIAAGLLTVEARMRHDGQTLYLLAFGTSAAYGYVRTTSAGEIQIRLYDNSGVESFFCATDDQPLASALGKIRTFRISADVANTTCNLWLEDDEGVMQLHNTGTFGTSVTFATTFPGSAANRQYNCLGAAYTVSPYGGNGGIVSVETWEEYLEPGDTPSVALDFSCYADGEGSWTDTEPVITAQTRVAVASSTFTLDDVYENGVTDDGFAYVVAPLGLTVETLTPAEDSSDHLVNGAQISPDIATGQSVTGYNEWSTLYNASAKASFPAAVAAEGSVLQGLPSTQGQSASETYGLFSETNAIQLVDAAPTPSHTLFSPGVIDWTGRTSRSFYDLDIDTLLNSFPQMSGASIASIMPEFTTFLEQLQRPNLIRAQVFNSVSTGHMRHSITESYPNDPQDLYGRYTSQIPDVTGGFLCTDLIRQDQKRKLLIASISQGIQILDPMENEPKVVGRNGGIWQQYQLFVMLALKAMERPTSDIFDSVPGNLAQPFVVTQTMIDNWWGPHTDDTGPWQTRLTTLSAVSGDGLSVTYDPAGPNNATGYYATFTGQKLVRASDGAEAEITGYTNYNEGVQAGADLVLDTAIPGLTTSDEVYIKPAYTPTAGEVDWNIGAGQDITPAGQMAMYIPAANAPYRALWRLAGQLYTARALGLQEAAFDPAFTYAGMCIDGTRGFPVPWDNGTVAKAFITAQRSAIEAM